MLLYGTLFIIIFMFSVSILKAAFLQVLFHTYRTLVRAS